MKLRIIALMAFAGMIAFLPTSARADGVSYNFGGCTDGHICLGDVGSTSANYTVNGFTIQATGFSAANQDLFIKTSGGDENGLGMVGTTDHEIQPGEFIQLNLSSLAKAGLTGGYLTLGSVQLGEGYQICASGSSGIDSGSCFSGNLDGSPVYISFSIGSPFIDVTATTGDVLIAKGLVATPEPSSLMLLGTGLLALVGLTLRKKVFA